MGGQLPRQILVVRCDDKPNIINQLTGPSTFAGPAEVESFWTIGETGPYMYGGSEYILVNITILDVKHWSYMYEKRAEQQARAQFDSYGESGIHLVIFELGELALSSSSYGYICSIIARLYDDKIPIVCFTREYKTDVETKHWSMERERLLNHLKSPIATISPVLDGNGRLESVERTWKLIAKYASKLATSSSQRNHVPFTPSHKQELFRTGKCKRSKA